MDKKRDWSTADISLLIDRYRSLPALWDVNSKLYRVKDIKLEGWTDLANTFDTTVAEVQRKMHNLRNQFVQELRKTENEQTQYTPKWPFYKKFVFIKARCSHDPPPATEVGDNENSSLDVDDATMEDDHMDASNSNGTTAATSSPAKRPPTKRQRRSHCHRPTPPPPMPAETLQRQRPASSVTAAVNGLLDQPQASPHQSSTQSANSPDVYDAFGTFLASEMRQLRHESNRSKLKRMVLQCLLQVSEEDDMTALNQDMVYVPVHQQVNGGATSAAEVDLLPNEIGVSFGRLIPNQ